MSVIVDVDRCDGCGRCAEICPGNLLDMDTGTGRAVVRDPRDCWDCMACVKVCPSEALEPRLPFQIAGYGASLKPTVYPDRIVWVVEDVRGQREEFTIKTLEV